MSNVKGKIWFERYRPKSVEELILPERIKTQLDSFIKSGDIPNLLFYSPGGMGKTSTAKIIINALKMDFIEINGSIDTGIDTVRDTVVRFAGTTSLVNTDANKCIFVTEADGFSNEAKDSMKNIIEKFSDNIRFIFDTNNVNKLSQPIRSRCVEIDFNFSKNEYPELMKQMLKRCSLILEENNVEYDKKDVAALIKQRFPDMRKIVNDLQRGSITGTFILDKETPEEQFNVLIKAMCDRNFDEIRRIVRNIPDPDNIYNRLYSNIDDIIEKKNIAQAILEIADFQYRAKICINPEINLVGCLANMLSKGIEFKCPK